MTIYHVIDTLDEFREEYSHSMDPEVKKLCGFIDNTMTVLEGYIRFFSHAKAQIERSQQYYEGALETINDLLEGDVDGESEDENPDEDGFDERSGLTIEDIVNAQE